MCRALAHAGALQALAAQADAHTAAGDLAAALASWREALPLLPARSVQYGQIASRIDELSKRVVNEPAAIGGKAGPGAKRGVFATLGGLALAFLGKAKFLLAGLAKAGTLLTMLLSFGAYWTLFGWPFAAGLVLSIYVHEMGHVAALRRFGVRTGAPTFIPASARSSFAAALRQCRRGRTSARGTHLGFRRGARATAVRANHQPIWAAIATHRAWITLQLDTRLALTAAALPRAAPSERFIACGALPASSP